MYILRFFLLATRQGRALVSMFFLMALLAVAGCSDANVSEELRRVVDAPVRVVWCRQQTHALDIYARENNFQLMGICSEDRQGARVILGKVGNYHKPLLTAEGNRIVFTDAPSKTIYAVNWDGTGLRELGLGVAEDVWKDPRTGIEWVYLLPNSKVIWDPSSPLIRFQLDNPAIEEVVFSEKKISSDHVQLSADGAYLCIQYPWPTMGRLNTQTGELKRSGKGCWPSMAPDNSYLMWIFDGPHRNLIFHSLDGTERWVVNVNHAPGIDGYEIYHPRWSNLDRFMSMSGPYRKGLLKTPSGVNIYVGRFSEKLTEVEEWVQVTDHKKSDYYPDVWVKLGVGRYADVDYGHLGEVRPIDHVKERLVVKAQLLEMTATPALADIAPYTQTMVVYRYRVTEVISGSYGQKHLLVAHWGIVDRKTRDLQLTIGDRVELELEPYANRGELEGERLIMELSNMNLPLFYDLKGK